MDCCRVGIQVIRREQARHQIHGDEDRRGVERPAAEHHIERPRRKGLKRRRLGDAAPEILQRRAGAFGAALGIAVDQHRRIHRAGRRAGNAIDSQPGLLEQAIEHAPGKGAMRAAALQREVDQTGITLIFPSFRD